MLFLLYCYFLLFCYVLCLHLRCFGVMLCCWFCYCYFGFELLFLVVVRLFKLGCCLLLLTIIWFCLVILLWFVRFRLCVCSLLSCLLCVFGFVVCFLLLKLFWGFGFLGCLWFVVFDSCCYRLRISFVVVLLYCGVYLLFVVVFLDLFLFVFFVL